VEEFSQTVSIITLLFKMTSGIGKEYLLGIHKILNYIWEYFAKFLGILIKPYF